MATSFPGSLDSFTNPTSTDTLASPDHAGQHANINDAVAALEAKVGVNSSAVTTSLDYKVANKAASSEAFVTIGNTAGLSAERALTAGAGITITDGGANSTVTIATNNLILSQPRSTFWASCPSFPMTAGGGGGGSTFANGTAFAVPFVVARSCTLDRIGIKINVAGSTGSVHRFAMYADDGNFHPGVLVADFGTASTAVGGDVAVTISQALSPGVVYWMVTVQQGAPATLATVRRNNSPGYNIGNRWSSLNDASNLATWNAVSDTFTGAAPANWTTTVNIIQSVPIIVLRYA